jgi:hypothetical protein
MARYGRSFALLAVAAVVVASAMPAPPLARAAATLSGSPDSWVVVRQQTHCEAMQDKYCRGRYGFTIEPDGAFVAGPTPAGDSIRGKIGREELRRLRELIDRVAPSLTSAETSCRPGGVPGVRDQVEITLAAGHTVLIYDLGGHVGMLCHAGEWDGVRALHDHLQKLLERYYPMPFPQH